MRIIKKQPPVGYRLPFSTLLRASAGRFGTDGGVEDFLDDLKRTMGVPTAFAVSSGKAALFTTLNALRRLTGRTKVVLPAYTCFSVPSAIVKAGLDPVPCDIQNGSFDYDYEQLEPLLGPDVLCVLSIHLFGIPSDTRRLKDRCRGSGIFVVEDAAQAFGVRSDGQWLGTRGDVGFFSLGRGKNVTTGAGGIIVANSEEIGRTLQADVQTLPTPGISEDARAGLALALMGVFIWPRLYWLPAGLPFLHLGETIFHEDFPVQKFSPFGVALMRDWWPTLERLNARRRRAGEIYVRRIRSAREYAPVPYLRFPVLIPNPERRRHLLEQTGPQLGVCAMYPATVGGIAQLRGRLDRYDFPQASRVAASLVTLPTHPLVCDRDLGRVCDVVNEALR